MIDKAVVAKQLEESMKEKVLEVLLIRHRHQNQKKMTENGGGKLLPTIRSFADIGKKGSFPKSIGNLGMIDSVKNKYLLRFRFFFLQYIYWYHFAQTQKFASQNKMKNL